MLRRRRALTVLLVQPQGDSLDLYSEFLAACGVRCLPVTNVVDAVSLAEHADIVVTGIMLNGTPDGVDLIAQLRARESPRRLPIIVLTACALEPERRRAVAAGCDAYLVKPCLPSDLFDEIRRIAAAARLPEATVKRQKVIEPAKMQRHRRRGDA